MAWWAFWEGQTTPIISALYTSTTDEQPCLLSRLYLRDQRANGVWGKGLEVGVWVSSTAMNGDIAQARSKQAKVARLFLVAEGR